MALDVGAIEVAACLSAWGTFNSLINYKSGSESTITQLVMKLFIFFLFNRLTRGQPEPSLLPNHLHDDIRYTACQNEFFQRVLGRGIPAEYIDDAPIAVKCPTNDRAISGSVIGWEQKWDNWFDESINKFKVAFYFANSFGTFTREEKSNIRTILAQFNEKTCVKLVEVEKSDPEYFTKIRVHQASKIFFETYSEYFEVVKLKKWNIQYISKKNLV